MKRVRLACFVVMLLLTVGATGAEAQDLSRIFGKTKGAFVLYDSKNNRFVRHNEARCRQRFTPASTFKIPNSLIGLETRVIRDADFVIPWDSRKYPNEGRPTIAPFSHWWQDHTLRSAMRYSVVWYYIELARQVGDQRMKQYVTQFRYGNSDTSGGIEQFWRNSSLQISADEQVDFLRRFYAGQLSVSKRSTEIVKDIILLEQTATYRLSGKTGAGPFNEGTRAWFVGYLERDGNVYFFALNMDGANYEAIRDERINLTKRILVELGYMSPVPISGQEKSRATLLPESAAPQVKTLCSRLGPAFDSTWQPTEKDILAMEARLSRISSLRSKSGIEGGRVIRPANYHRQYIGIIAKQRKLIFINAFCDDQPPVYWRERVVDVCDGGCAWGVIYDVARGEFSNLQMNGVG